MLYINLKYINQKRIMKSLRKMKKFFPVLMFGGRQGETLTTEQVMGDILKDGSKILFWFSREA